MVLLIICFSCNVFSRHVSTDLIAVVEPFRKTNNSIPPFPCGTAARIYNYRARAVCFSHFSLIIVGPKRMM